MSVRSQIIAQILDLLNPLIAQNKVRSVDRVHALFLQAAIKPALHLVVGDEVQVAQDNRGYTAEIGMFFEIIFDEVRDPEGKADELAAFIQRRVEADPQINRLANEITFKGVRNFVNDAIAPEALSIVQYTLQYRRERGNPDQNY